MMLTLLDGKTALCPVDPKWAFGQRQKWPEGVARGHSDQIDSLKYQSKINTNLVSHSLTFYFILFWARTCYALEIGRWRGHSAEELQASWGE